MIHYNLDNNNIFTYNRNLFISILFTIINLEQRLDFKFNDLTINVTPYTGESPTAFIELNTIFLFASSPQNVVFQLSHELVHIYLGKTPVKIHWLNELLASYTSQLINFDGYNEYLNEVNRNRKYFKTIDEVTDIVKTNINRYENESTAVYNEQNEDIVLSFKNLPNFDCFSAIKEFKDSLKYTNEQTDTNSYYKILLTRYEKSPLLNLLTRLN